MVNKVQKKEAKTTAVATTSKFVLVRGEHFSRHPETGETIIHKTGSIHDLTPNQAKAFKDKFKSYAEYVAEQNLTRRTAAALKAAEAKAAADEAEEQAELEGEADKENADAIDAANEAEQEEEPTEEEEEAE